MSGLVIGGLVVAVILCIILLVVWAKSSRDASAEPQDPASSASVTVRQQGASPDAIEQTLLQDPAISEGGRQAGFPLSDDEALRQAETRWAEKIDWKVAPDTTETIKPEPAIVYDSAKMPVDGAAPRFGAERRQRIEKQGESQGPGLLRPRYYGSAPPDLKYHTNHGVAPRVTREDLRETVRNPDIRYATRDSAKVSDRFSSGRVGEAGEAKTQRIVDEWAKRHHAVVRHGYFVNKQMKDSDVDHIIAFESDGVQHVLLLDSKNYAPGVYDRDRRMLDRSQTWEPFIQSNSMELATKQLEVTLLGMPFRSQVICYTVVWCSSRNGKVILRGYEKNSTIPINGEELPRLLGGFPDASAPNVGVVRALDWAFSPRGKVKKAWSLGMENAQRRQQLQGANRQHDAKLQQKGMKNSKTSGSAKRGRHTGKVPTGHGPASGHVASSRSQREDDRNPRNTLLSSAAEHGNGSAASEVFGVFNEGLGTIPQFADGTEQGNEDTSALDSREIARRTKEFEKHTVRVLDQVACDSPPVADSAAGADASAPEANLDAASVPDAVPKASGSSLSTALDADSAASPDSSDAVNGFGEH